GVGSPATYLECFEFFLAPYPVGGDPSQGDPDLAPDVTNNSWACPPSEGCSWNTLQAAVEAQRAAGIMTVVSAGNYGSAGCSTVEDPPAIYDAAYSVGATDSSDTVAGFSSRGPVTVDGSHRLKPDISAPGVSVRSSIPGGGYQNMSGTSMAGPHVAGAVALLWSAAPYLRSDITATEQVLNAGAFPRYSTQCGDPPDTVPNNVYGWGRLDILAAVQQALAATHGHLRGTVVASGTLTYPLPDALVHAITDTLPYTTTTDAQGAYSLTLAPDTYTVSAWRYGYRPATVPNVAVTGSMTTTLPFTLTASARYSVTGHISDTYTGEPLTATISVVGPFGVPVTETVAVGCYTLTLHGSPYTLTASAPRHKPFIVSFDLTTDTVQHFPLDPVDGLLWGYVTNRATGNPVSGAKVQTMPGGQGTNTAADGYYEISLPPGVYTVTASASLYGSVVETDVVIPTATQVRRDYALPAPYLSLLPLVMLSVTLDYDGLATETLTVSNTGGLTLTFTVDEPSAPWLTVTPLSGTVAPSRSVPLSVTFAAAPVAYGVYLADLRFRTNDPEAQPYRDYATRLRVLPPPPSLSIVKEPSAPTVEAGLPLTYTLIVSNAGGPATGVVVSDTLPPHTIFAWAGGADETSARPGNAGVPSAWAGGADEPFAHPGNADGPSAPGSSAPAGVVVVWDGLTIAD
ncbi:MAG TPA: DUF11 domain-containing protein, partial [Anaerolineae bacterium]|nr:DUF11 domain-containing protein [Anaerolineae bacterium]